MERTISKVIPKDLTFSSGISFLDLNNKGGMFRRSM